MRLNYISKKKYDFNRPRFLVSQLDNTQFHEALYVSEWFEDNGIKDFSDQQDRQISTPIGNLLTYIALIVKQKRPLQPLNILKKL